MITVVTPFRRKENLPFLIGALEGKCRWTVLIDDLLLRGIFPEWVDVRFYVPEGKGCISNELFNMFIEEGLEDDTQYMILCDDDSIEDGFFDKIPNEDVVIASMKRGDRVPADGVGYGWGDLIASPDNIGIGKVAGEQLVIKGRVLKDYRYGLSAIGDGEMIMQIAENHPVIYVPDAHVLFNYLEDGRYDSFRRRPIVLFIGDFYCAGNPAMGKSEWEGNLWASLESTGLADVARFHMDKYYYHTGRRGDEALLERIEELKPDKIVLVLYKPVGSDPTVISETTLDAMSQSAPQLITIWGDLEAEEQRHLAIQIERYCSKVIGTANKEVVESLGYKYMHVPKDPRVFHGQDILRRHIDVVFSGSFGAGREERREVLQYLVDNGVNLVAGGSEGGDHFTTEEYADRYRFSKIAISFSQARGMNVVNARPFEVMSCGAMLLEQKSPELAKLYKEGEDYGVWITKVDLLEKIRYYLEHDEERIEMAVKGQQKTERLYSAKTFWEEALK